MCSSSYGPTISLLNQDLSLSVELLLIGIIHIKKLMYAVPPMIDTQVIILDLYVPVASILRYLDLLE